MAWWYPVYCLLLGSLLKTGETRQKCFSCQYQTNPQNTGHECMIAPSNWTGGSTRTNCPELCVIDARFNLKGEPTFFFRGCAAYDENRKDGCTRSTTMDICTFTCGGGGKYNYCNDRKMATSPYEDPNGGAVGLWCEWWMLILSVTITTCLMSPTFPH